MSRVVKLVDTNGDGIMDQHTVFIDNVILPRPVWTETAPDETLVFSDMYRGIIQEEAWFPTGPDDEPAERVERYHRVKKWGMLKVIRHGRIYRMAPDGKQSGPEPRMLEAMRGHEEAEGTPEDQAARAGGQAIPHPPARPPWTTKQPSRRNCPSVRVSSNRATNTSSKRASRRLAAHGIPTTPTPSPNSVSSAQTPSGRPSRFPLLPLKLRFHF